MWDLYDLWQDYRSRDIEHAANRAERAASSLEQRLTGEVDSLRLACAAMWEILEERLGVTPKELAERMTQIDLRDGRLDGRMSTQAVACATCGRRMSARRAHCLFCGGTALEKQPLA